MLTRYTATHFAGQENVKNRTETESDWGGQRRAYSVSKALINGLTRVLAAEEEKQGSGVLINCCCPG